MRIISVVLYIAFAVWNAGAINANMRGEYWYRSQNKRERVQTLSFSVGIALFPPTWIVSPFITGFYQDGWSLSTEGV